MNQKFPSGGVEGDYVAIDGWAHYWNANRGTWCVNAQRDSYWDELITGIIEKFKLFKGATYMGVAGLDTVPAKAIGAKMYYFATVAGTYKNFGGLVVPQGINVLYSENGNSWVCSTLLEVAQELGVSTRNVVSQKVVNEALAKKADKADMDVELGKKANTADVNTKFTEEKKRVDGELDKKFDKESIAQEDGDSEVLVMSQKSVSDKLSDLSSKKVDKTSIVQEFGNSKDLVPSQDTISRNYNILFQSTLKKSNLDQEIGSSTEKVVSQKAITERLLFSDENIATSLLSDLVSIGNVGATYYGLANERLINGKSYVIEITLIEDAEYAVLGLSNETTENNLILLYRGSLSSGVHRFLFPYKGEQYLRIYADGGLCKNFQT